MEVRNLLPVFCFFLGLSLVIAITGYAVEGETTSSVSVDGIRILVDTFDGDTNEFVGLSTLEINNMTNLTLENTTYGKVIFNASINLTLVAGVDRIVDFDSDLNISDNLVTIDSVELPNMNKLATVFLYNLNFTTPQIIKGGSICSDCTQISYSGGTLIFTTTTFTSAYYARETPTTVCGNGICETGETTETCPADCPADSGGGGGGGGGTPSVATPSHSFYIEPEFTVITLNQGEYFQKNVKIVNNGTGDLDIGLSIVNLTHFIFPQEYLVHVNAGENYTLRLNIYASEGELPDVYVGKVIFATSLISRDLKVILDVKARDALFDIRTEVLKKYVNPGGRVRANISIINMGSLRNFDVSLEYKILDFENREYTIKKEDFAMNRSYFNVFYLEVPKDTTIGDYIFYAKVNYTDISASSFDTFTVEKLSTWAWIFIIIAIFIIILLIVRRFKRKDRLEKRALKEKEEKSRVVKVPLVRRRVKIPKLPEF